MAIDGERFLELNRKETLWISRHAMCRMSEFAGWKVPVEMLEAVFMRARQLKIGQIAALGYRPRYGDRLAAGVKSWYFRFVFLGREMIAVVSQMADSGELVWATTYCRDGQNDALQSLSYADLQHAA